jgi:transcriptional regulator with XRE-family HTH domain
VPNQSGNLTLRLPKSWNHSVRSAVLHTISLAHYASTQAYGKAAVSISPFLRMKAENQRLRQKVAQLQEEIRIKDARMTLLLPQRRPHYPSTERMAILELRAARGWSLAQTARAFLVTPLTIAQWLRRLDEQGPNALLRLPEPVNKFPEFVGYLVRRLKTLCPTLGKQKIAQMLARAGLHLGTTTVSRMLKQAPSSSPLIRKNQDEGAPQSKPRVVTAKRPNHVWHVDLTVVPTTGGFWAAWSPFALPQCWPFGWWVAVIVDHFSRRVSWARRPSIVSPRRRWCGLFWGGRSARPRPRLSTSSATAGRSSIATAFNVGAGDGTSGRDLGPSESTAALPSWSG